MTRKRPYMRFVLSLFVSSVSVCHALSTDVDQPMDIESTSLEYDETTNTVIHRGNVVASQGSRCLTGDLLTLTFNADNRVESAHLEGTPAIFSVRPDNKRSDIVGRSLSIDFDAVENVLTLIGDATLSVDADQYRASRMTYDIDAESISTVDQRAAIRPSRASNETALPAQTNPCAPK